MKHEVLVYNKTAHRIPKRFIQVIVLRALDFLKLKQPVELAVLVVDSNEIKKLNKVWRGRNKIIDELSFGLNSRQTAGFAKINKNMLSLGELVINKENLEDKLYLKKILIHGLLHLLGYTHESMRHLEIKILKHLNI